jgi:predicted amidohydrolase YtcJ
VLGPPPESTLPPDLLLTNGDIFVSYVHASELAIRDGKIVRQYKIDPAHTRVIDLHGASAIVGLTDAHCHLYGLGTDLENVNVRNLPSEAAVVATITKAAKTRPQSEWLVGRGWDQNKWPGQQFPTKTTLDAAVNDRPVLLRRIDGHAAWVNSRALADANITKDTPDPAGGKIVRDATGEPTGLLIDNAQDLVDAKIPAPSAEVRERRILAAAKLATSLGLTGVDEMGIERETAAVYRTLAADKRLPLHVHAYLLGDPAHPDVLRTEHPEPPVGRFEMRGVKFFADGALGSRGARLYADYDDDPGNRGLWVTEPDALAKAVDAAVAGGWQVAIHAIGDAGIGSVLDAYQRQPTDRRLRIEHLQVLAPQDLNRVVSTHAVASMQPTHATSDMAWAESRIGPERIKGSYAWRTMLDHHVMLAFGSDFPIEDVDPRLGLEAAVHRGNWHTEQAVDLDEAVAAFTTGAAYAAFDEGNGRGDVTIFDGKLTPDTILQRKVVMTIVDGQIVYEAAKQ